jgi:hypothetical protein
MFAATRRKRSVIHIYSVLHAAERRCRCPPIAVLSVRFVVSTTSSSPSQCATEIAEGTGESTGRCACAFGCRRCACLGASQSENATTPGAWTMRFPLPVDDAKGSIPAIAARDAAFITARSPPMNSAGPDRTCRAASPFLLIHLDRRKTAIAADSTIKRVCGKTRRA